MRGEYVTPETSREPNLHFRIHTSQSGRFRFSDHVGYSVGINLDEKASI